MTYTVARQGSTLGSFSQYDVAEGAAAGQFFPDDLVWTEGMSDWKPLSSVFPSTKGGGPPPLPPQAFVAQPPQMPQAPKSLGDDAGMRMLIPVGRSGWAIASGYLALFSVLILPAPLALITAILAIRDIKRSKGSPHPKHGMGRAIFGLVMGIAGSLVLLLGLIAKALGS